MVALYAWDYHGTLAKDNELAVMRALNQTFHEQGIPKRATQQEVVDLYGKTWGDYFRHYLPGESPDRIADLVEIAKPHAGRFVPKHIKPMEYACEVLAVIKNHDDSNIIISNMTQSAYEFFMLHTPFGNLIDHFIGISGDYEINGDLDGFDSAQYKGRQLREYAGNRFDAISMIGDRESDVEAGKLAGAARIYLFAPHQRSHVREDGVRVINDLREVLH